MNQTLRMAALVCAALLVWPLTAAAHKVSTAFLTLNGDPDNPALLHGTWDIALLDLDFVLGLDANGNGAVTWGELRRRHSDIADYALAHLAIRNNGATCPLQAGEQQVDSHSDGTYSVLQFNARCEHAPRELVIDYRLFYGVDPSHRGIITLRYGQETASAVSAPGDPSISSPSITMHLPGTSENIIKTLRRFWPVIALLALFLAVGLIAVFRRRQPPRHNK